MPYIYLDATDTNNHYGKYQTSVIKDTYSRCKLFTKYRHTSIRGSGKGDIKIYKKYSSWIYGPNVTLTVIGKYTTASLSREDVYFNKYDSTNTPLVLVLFFKGNPRAYSRYYVRSKFEKDKTRSRPIRIYDLKLYDLQSQFISDLLSENDKLTNLLTFDISKKDQTRGNGTNYNDGKITVKKLIDFPVSKYRLVELVETVVSEGFVIYRHEPVYKHEQKPSCFIYQNQVLMGRKSGHPYPITEIQGSIYSIIVYYSNDLSEPLLLEFDFRPHNSSNVDNLYYIRKKDRHGSYFERLSTTTNELKTVLSTSYGPVYGILKVDRFQVLIGLLNIIIERLENVIIYRLEKNRNNHGYDSRMIKVTKETTAESSITKHKHEPTSEYQNKTQLLYYNGFAIQLVPNNSISNTEDRLQTNNIQNSKFSEISTYALSHTLGEHLLIRLTISSWTNYYLYRYSKDGSKWKQLSLEELKDAGIDVISVSGSDLSQQLEELLGESQSNNVMIFLKYISFSVNSIIILMDEKSGYDKSNISPLIKNGIPPIDIESNRVFVFSDKINEKKCINPYNYKVYKHHINEAGPGGKRKAKGSDLYIRLYLLKKGLRLYNDTKENSPPTYLKYIESDKYIHVYYYGDIDPRPLLLCYGGNTYRPLSCNDYDKKWVKEEKAVRCECESHGIHPELLNVLSRVVGSLNEVKLDERFSYMFDEFDLQIKTEFYVIHYYNRKPIQVKLTYEKRDTYEVYKHEPNEDGYRLGAIKYNSSTPEETGLTYDLNRQLKSVSALFSTQHFKYPFLIELEFKNGGFSGSTKEYYGLRNNEKRWIKMNSDGVFKHFHERMTQIDQKRLEAHQLKKESEMQPKSSQQEESDRTLDSSGYLEAEPLAKGNRETSENISPQEPSLPSSVAETPGSHEQNPQDRPSETRTRPVLTEGRITETTPWKDNLSQDGASESSSSQGATSRTTTPKETPQISGRPEPGGQPADLPVTDLHLHERGDLKRPQEQAETVSHGSQQKPAQEVLTQQANDQVYTQQSLDQKLKLVQEMQSIRVNSDGTPISDEINIPAIAGGAASGVASITGSVVGYIVYAKYCKAKPPILK